MNTRLKSLLVALALAAIAYVPAQAQPDIALFQTMISKAATNQWATTCGTAEGLSTNFVAAQVKTNNLRFGVGVSVMVAAYIRTNGVDGTGVDVGTTNGFIDFALSMDKTNWTSTSANSLQTVGLNLAPLRFWFRPGTNNTPRYTITNFPASAVGNFRYIRPDAFGLWETNNMPGNLIISNLWMSINYAP